MKKLSDNELKKFKPSEDANKIHLSPFNPADIINRMRIYNINGIEYTKQEIDKDGLWIMNNVRTG